MSNVVSYPSDGITQLIVEEIARDGVIRGGAPEIQVLYEPFARDGAPTFVPEGTAVRFHGAAAYRIGLPDGVGLVLGVAHGDLRVQNVADDLQIEAVCGDLRLDALPGEVVVGRAEGDVRAEKVRCLRLTGACQGDLRFDSGGELAAATLAGDLRLTGANEITLGQVHGDISAERVAGDFRIERAGGDVRLSGVEGATAIGRLAGDLRAAGLVGGLVAQVSGDASLSGPFAAATGYMLSADGDVSCDLPADADVRLTVNARGRVRSDVPLTPAGDGTPNFTAATGSGNVGLTLNAAGDVRISQAGATGGGKNYERRGRGGDPLTDLSNLGDRIRQQVMTSLASAGINIETGEVAWSRGGRGPKSPRPPMPPERPKPPAAPAITAEQMTILRLVEEGKITPEEADVLLKALGA